jgi:predicted 3-demethylubiquinone-9 3-methyltransferase (glyoxalase superfamily)
MQKITPFLWFDDNAEEAVNFYISVFKNSKSGNATHYDEAGAEVSGRPQGSVMSIPFQLNGQEFVALNGGPIFKFNPSVSFFLNFDPSQEENARKHLDDTWEKLSEGGATLMPLDKYPFSERYGWIQDKYGISWQLILTNPEGEQRPFIVPSFLFVGAVSGKAEEASDFYLSVFKNTKRGLIARYPTGLEPDKEGTIMYTDFMLENQWFAAMDSAHHHDFNFNEAISFMVNCENQNEVDHFWKKLSAVPESEQCGWLKDKYGLSWQIVPTELGKLLSDPDPIKSQRVMKTMLQMKKIEIEGLRKAYNEK